MQNNPGVAALLATPVEDFQWCDKLETLASDPVDGKVLCVCAAVAVARKVLANSTGPSQQDVDTLDLLDEWIDDPTDERFDRICSIIFGEANPAEPDLDDLVWWALRTATSSVGNYEGGWALQSTCAHAEKAGFRPDELRGAVEHALISRSAGNP